MKLWFFYQTESAKFFLTTHTMHVLSTYNTHNTFVDNKRMTALSFLQEGDKHMIAASDPLVMLLHPKTQWPCYSNCVAVAIFVTSWWRFLTIPLAVMFWPQLPNHLSGAGTLDCQGEGSTVEHADFFVGSSVCVCVCLCGAVSTCPIIATMQQRIIATMIHQHQCMYSKYLAPLNLSIHVKPCHRPQHPCSVNPFGSGSLHWIKPIHRSHM